MHSGRPTTHEHEPGDAPSLRPLALCVDDFGLHAGIQDAVARLAELGRVQAIGVMVGGPALPGGLALLRGLDPAAVEVGLHLDFTEHPLAAASRRPLRAWLAGRPWHRHAPAALRAEIAAQLNAFEAATGRPPAFVDGHQHVHQMAGLRESLLDELSQRYGAGLPWLRSTRPAPGAGAKAWLLHALGGRRLDALARQRGFRQNHRLLGVYDFQGGPARYRGLMQGWLRVACAGDELMCHPATRTAVADPIGPARRAEFELLAGSEFTTLLAAAGVRLAPLGAWLRHAGAPAG